MSSSSGGADWPALAAYLAASGWTQTDRADDRRAIWVDSNDVRIFVPTQWGPDSEELMSVALAKLARSESRPVSDVRTDLEWSRYDKLVVQRETDSASSLPFDDGLALHSASHDLIVASALATHEPRGSYGGGRRSSYVNGYLDAVRLIPSIAGSFVVRALLPLRVQQLSSEYVERQLPGTEATSNGRLATSMIIKAATRAVTTATSVGAGDLDLGAWDLAVGSGVSSNLCDALARMTGHESQGSDVRISVDFTWMEPASVSAETLEIPRGLAPVLNAGSEYLKERGAEEQIQMIGMVTNLHREPASGPGEITLKGAILGEGSRSRSVRFELDEESYHMALRAHDEGTPLELQATIRRERRRLSVVAVHRIAPLTI